MPPFTFRQRANRINWNEITSLKLNDVIVNTNIKKLQNVIDIVIFSYFNHEEVRNNSIESISKLVNILQLISEYLLHCQEEQFKLIRDSQSKLNKNIHAYDKIFKENIALKEDRKIYQRQLAILRKSLGPSFFLSKDELNDASNYNSLTNKRKQLNKDDFVDNNNNNHTIIIQSILKREEDNRLFMSTMMNDQKQLFLEQMKILTDSLLNQKNNNNQNDNNNNMLLNELFFQKIESQMNQTIKQAITNMEQKMQSTIDTFQNNIKPINNNHNNSNENRPNIMSSNRKKEVEDILKEASEEVYNELNNNSTRKPIKRVLSSQNIEEQLKDINKKEIFLNEKEKELLILEKMLEAKEKDLLLVTRGNDSKQLILTSRIQHENERLNLLTENEVIKSNTQLLIVRKFFASYLIVFQKYKLSAFRKWYQYVLYYREQDIHNHYNKQLLYTKEHRTKVEIELVNQLQIEKDKNISYIDKNNQLENKIILLEKSLNDLKQLNNNNNIEISESEIKLKNELQIEKEKNIINNSKYKTLKIQSEKEIQDLKERLTPYELKYNPILSGFKSSGVNTSLDYLLPSSRNINTIIPSMSSLRSSYQRNYMNNDQNEQDLYEIAQKRLNYRIKNQQNDLELQAISSLAIELNAKFNKSNLKESI